MNNLIVTANNLSRDSPYTDSMHADFEKKNIVRGTVDRFKFHISSQREILIRSSQDLEIIHQAVDDRWNVIYIFLLT